MIFDYYGLIVIIETFLECSKMAKKRRTNTGVSAITSLLGAINKVAEAELGDNVSPDKQAEANKAGLAAVKKATAEIGDSNVMTALEVQDDAIVAMHDADDAAEEAEHNAEVAEADADQAAIEAAEADADEQTLEEQEEQTEQSAAAKDFAEIRKNALSNETAIKEADAEQAAEQATEEPTLE